MPRLRHVLTLLHNLAPRPLALPMQLACYQRTAGVRAGPDGPCTEQAPVCGRKSILPRLRIEKFCLCKRAGSALPPLPALGHATCPLQPAPAQACCRDETLPRARLVACSLASQAHLPPLPQYLLFRPVPADVCAYEGGPSGNDTGIREHMAGKAPAPDAPCRQQSSQDTSAWRQAPSLTRGHGMFLAAGGAPATALIRRSW